MIVRTNVNVFNFSYVAWSVVGNVSIITIIIWLHLCIQLNTLSSKPNQLPSQLHCDSLPGTQIDFLCLYPSLLKRKVWKDQLNHISSGISFCVVLEQSNMFVFKWIKSFETDTLWCKYHIPNCSSKMTSFLERC